MRRFASVVVTLVVGFVSASRGQSPRGLGDLRWDAAETQAGRFVVVPGERAFLGGYSNPGLEMWAYPLQLLRGYWVSFRIAGDSVETDARSVLRSFEVTPIATTRVYQGPGFTVRERLFTPVDLPAATITYTVESRQPVEINVHFIPTLNLMWPGAVGGQEIHWDSTHSAYVLDEPSRRFRGAIVSKQIARHEQFANNTRGAEFERTITFSLRGAASVSFAATSTGAEDPVAVADSLASQVERHEAAARSRLADLHVLEVTTPDTSVNRAIRWAQVTLAQAWACNPQLGCGLLAGYGPSRGARRPQYAWFFANDGLVAVDALLREGAYRRARDELAFIMRYQNRKTGKIWHELSQSAGFLDWERAYPYMFVHVDISFDFLNTMRDYVETTGDIAFANANWNAIRAAYDYCRSTIPLGGVLPVIPAGQQGRDEQDPQRDELTLSLAWVSATESFAELARLTNHVELDAPARRASATARSAIRPMYFDSLQGRWLSGHLRSGAPVEGLTSSLIALLHHGLLGAAEQRALLDSLASPPYRAPWGIRSTPSNSPLFDPDSYARGSVWAIGTADAINAFYEAGRDTTATRLWRDLVPWFELDALGHMHEVLRGDRFAPERESVPDQSWSSASFLSSAIRGMLGLRVDATKRQLHFTPRIPAEWDSVRIGRIDLAGSDVGLVLRTGSRMTTVEVENAGPAMTLTFRPSLPNGARVRAAEVTAGARVLSTAERSGVYEISVFCPAGQSTRLSLRY